MQTFRSGRRMHTPGFTIVYAPAPKARAAAVVSKKIARTAVARNRLRRRIYAALYEAGIGGGHIIVVAKHPAVSYSYARLEEEISGALSKLALFGRARSR